MADFAAWIVLGLAAGWVAALVRPGSRQALLAGLAAGVAGAVAGGLAGRLVTNEYELGPFHLGAFTIVLPAAVAAVWLSRLAIDRIWPWRSLEGRRVCRGDGD